METINREDACLYVDVVCAVCEKRMALSNAYALKGVYYCADHQPDKKRVDDLLKEYEESWTNQFLKDLQNKQFSQRHAAEVYTVFIALEETNQAAFDWEKINAAIIDRWSESGLTRIKTAAWKGLE